MEGCLYDIVSLNHLLQTSICAGWWYFQKIFANISQQNQVQSNSEASRRYSIIAIFFYITLKE